VKSTNYEASRYAMFSSLLKCPPSRVHTYSSTLCSKNWHGISNLNRKINNNNKYMRKITTYYLFTCSLSLIRDAWTISFYIRVSLEPGKRSRYNDWLRAGRQRGWSSSPSRVKNFLFSTSSRPSLLSNWYRGWSCRGVKLTTHLQPVSRSRIRGSIHPLPHTPSWRSA
jgi:hypothetical protein